MNDDFLKKIMRLALNPFVIGGVAAYIGHRKFGKKYKYWAPVGAGVAGYLGGSILQKQFFPPQPALPVAMPQQQVEGDFGGEYVELDAPPLVGPHEALRHSPGAIYPGGQRVSMSPERAAQMTAEEVSREDLGSLGGGGSGLGGFEQEDGFSGDQVEENIDQIYADNGLRRPNGAN